MVNRNSALLTGSEAGHDAQQRSFAAARWTHQCNQLTASAEKLGVQRDRG
jgi:hypothetical protein